MCKNVVVTVAASGIGYYIAKQYALNKNYKVFCFDINKVEGINEVNNIIVDLRVEKLVKKCFSEIETIDIE